MTIYDDPNREALGLAPAWEEGEGGEPGAGGGDPQMADEPLESMTKADLVSYANANGIEVDPAATKAEIRETIEEAEG